MSEKLTLEAANKQLSDIVDKMENGELSLKESMEYYEKAFELLSFCYKQLDDCKLKITDINSRIDELQKNGELFDE